MKIYIVDDDDNIINLLKIIINERQLGEICGISNNGEDALEDFKYIKPDIVIVDLLMPMIDGITLVKYAKPLLKSTSFIMLSQVSSKDMVASAYENGIEFYIHKPINGLEVESVIKNISNNLKMKRTFDKMNSIFINEVNSEKVDNKYNNRKKSINKIETVLKKLGIIGDIGAKDILKLVDYLNSNNDKLVSKSLSSVCKVLSVSPKSFEQRIRRTAYNGLVNLANLGIEDYSNDVFVEYSNSLYNFEQVKKEMDYIRGKSNSHGKVYIKKFIKSLLFYC